MNSSYMTRALRARDPRFAQILGKLGYSAPAHPSEPAVAPAVASVAPSADPPASRDTAPSEKEPHADPLDHDSDGKKGGSKPAELSDELSALRAEYQAALGKKPFHGWDGETMKAKIAAASA